MPTKCEETAEALFKTWIDWHKATIAKDAEKAGALSIDWELMRGELWKACGSNAQQELNKVWVRFREATAP